MYVQTLSISNSSHNPPNFSPSVHSPISYPPNSQCTKILSISRISFGFCNLAKMGSLSATGLRNHGGMVSIRCEGVDNRDDNEDGFYIRRCVEIARKAVGCTSPNPMVGCVIVKDGKVVGEGFHPKAGQPHAEVFALRDAGNLAESGTAYVSLEPCNHYGRTPPCTEALIKAKVKRVVVGMVDPNPIVASKGVDRLRDAGIDVTVGVEEEMCKKLNEAYIHQMLTGKPFTTLRYSLSVNGHLSNDLGEKAGESGGYYSQLLQENDAVIVASTSYSCPASKEPKANQPFRIVVAKNPTSPFHVPLLNSEATSNVVIFTDGDTRLTPESVQQGIETVVLDKINLLTILEYCKGRGMCSVLLDLRGDYSDFKEIVTEGFEHNLLQKFVVEVLPVWGKSKDDLSLEEIKSLGRKLSLKELTSRMSGKSILLEGYF